MAKLKEAIELHHNEIVADLHCDTALQIMRGYQLGKKNSNYHVDIPRLQEAGVNLQVFAAFVDADTPDDACFDQADITIKKLKEQFEINSDQICHCRTESEAMEIISSGRIAAFIGIENGMAIESDLNKLEYFHQQGVRYITLTHYLSHQWCASSNAHGADDFGLTSFGKEVIKNMNRLGMIVDVSHISKKAFYDVMDTTTMPVIASHSNAFAICPHSRNLDDEQLKLLAETGGMTGMNFCRDFLDKNHSDKSMAYLNSKPEEKHLLEKIFTTDKEEGRDIALKNLADFIDGWHNAVAPYIPSPKTIADHIDHIKNIAGDECIGYGTDFDGIFFPPDELDDISKLPAVTAELMNRGYKTDELKKIIGLNFMRVFKAVCS